MMKLRLFLFVIFSSLGLVACASPGAPAGLSSPETATLTALPPSPIALTLTRAASPTVPPSLTPTATWTPTQTPTPTPTPHPLTLAWLRDQVIPGSEIILEETLTPGPNYNRYLASYRSEGLKIYALLTIPYGERPATGWPAIVFNHGYIPPDVYRTTERYIAYVDGFARSGYIVFRPDYRGHGNSEGEARGAYGSPDYTIDVLNALAALKSYPDADPDRLGMWGHSMGGYITLRAMVVSEDIKAGVIWAGVVGPYPNLFERPLRTTSEGGEVFPTPDPTSGRGRWRQTLLETYGSPEQNPAFWASISANTYLADLSGPLQLHHGTADTSVPVAASELLQAQMDAAGMPSELYIYEGDDHNLSVYFTAAMQRSIAFFNQHVKGDD